MSELQIWLLVVGVVVIVGVVIYNRVQEARFRARAESAFAQPQGDALLESGPPRTQASERIEPQFQDDEQAEPAGVPHRQEPRALTDVGPEPAEMPVQAAPAMAVAMPAASVAEPAAMAAPAAVAQGQRRDAEPARAKPSPPQAQASASQPDQTLAQIAYVAEVRAREPLPASALDQLVRALGPLMARVQLLGRQREADAWQAIDASSPQAVRELRAALQLVDRRGAVTQQDIVIFQSAVARCAASSGASASIPDAGPFLARSRQLDDFCTEVDVVVGINLVAQPGKPIVGTRLRGLAEAAGFRVERGAFVFPDGHGGARFTLEQQDGASITPDALRTLQATALTLLLDVPRQPDGVAAFDQMVAVGRQLAQSLGARLVDDNQAPVSETGLDQIRSQLRAIYATMDAHGIPGGGPAALRLFS
jgi:FtsZ-interacting cell division protein ZipA